METIAKHSSVEAKIGSVTFTLSWDGDIMVSLSGGEQDRARKLVNGFKLLGSENGAPRERKKRMKRIGGSTDNPTVIMPIQPND